MTLSEIIKRQRQSESTKRAIRNINFAVKHNAQDQDILRELWEIDRDLANA